MKESMGTIISDNDFPFFFIKYLKLNNKINYFPFVFIKSEPKSVHFLNPQLDKIFDLIHQINVPYRKGAFFYYTNSGFLLKLNVRKLYPDQGYSEIHHYQVRKNYY